MSKGYINLCIKYTSILQKIKGSWANLGYFLYTLHKKSPFYLKLFVLISFAFGFVYKI